MVDRRRRGKKQKAAVVPKNGRPCRFWMTGVKSRKTGGDCTDGDNCAYAHDEQLAADFRASLEAEAAKQQESGMKRRNPSSSTPETKRPKVGPDRVIGTAKRWNERGFGFIAPDAGGDDVFCHTSDIADGNMLPEGGRVEYEKVWDEKKQKFGAKRVEGGTGASEENRPKSTGARRGGHTGRRR